MISIKPHHFVDIITAYGKGVEVHQPSPYGHAVHTVARDILADHGVDLRMDFGADDICKPCCHNVDGACDDTLDISSRPEAPASKGAYNLQIDRRWGERLAIQEGDTMTATDLCIRIRDRAGDLADIYREEPADWIVQKQALLMKGVEKYLEGSG